MKWTKIATSLQLYSNGGSTRAWTLAVQDFGLSGMSPYIVAPNVEISEGSPGELSSGADLCSAVLVEDRDYESGGVRPPAVTYFGGCWVMVYVTELAGTFDIPGLDLGSLDLGFLGELV